jgi:HSP20 family protein
MERSHGTFLRSFALPDAADADGITAAVRDGVVTVVVPKKEAPARPAPKEIPVAAE